jgi:hypothetical protein
MTHNPAVTVQLVWGLLHTLCIGAACCAHGYVMALHYDRRNLKCAYFEKSTGPYLFMSIALVAAFASAVVGVVVVFETPVPFLLVLIQSAVHILVAAVVECGRQPEQFRLISVRYMQHKYGLDADLLMQLLERHRLRHFPVAYFEVDRMPSLTAEQRDSYSADEQTRAQMMQVVQKSFILPLSRPDSVDCSSRLAFFREECNKTRHVVKLHKLLHDFYAKH